MRKFWGKTIALAMTALVCGAGAIAQSASKPVKLVYPKWIPGEHSPSGPITDVTGVKFLVNGKEVQWRRNTVDLYSFECVVPAGGETLEATLDYLLPAESSAAGVPSASAQLAVLRSRGACETS